MSEDEMIAQLFIFFVAGYETTATTVTVILNFLAKHPQYIEKIRKEAEQEITDMNRKRIQIFRGIPDDGLLANMRLNLIQVLLLNPFLTHVQC